MNKKALLTIALGSFALILAGCTSGKADETNANKTLNVTLSGNPATADPALSGDRFSSAMIGQTYEGLYTYDKKGDVVPGVATKVVKPTNNGTVYTYTLKKDAKWANGEEVTAQDFVTSFEHEVDPTSKSQIASDFKYFKNYQAVQDGKVKPSALGVKALGEKKLQITLSKPQPWLNDILASKGYPINTKAFKKYGSKYGTSSAKTVSNGPYKLAKWDGTSDDWEYQKNTNYWDAKNVKINKVAVQVVKEPGTAQSLFTSGKVQETAIQGTYVKNNEKSKNLKTTLNGSMRFLEFNDKKTVTHNTKVRQAFSYLVNREQVTKNVLQDARRPQQV